MNKTTCINSAEQTPKGEIIAYHADGSIHLDVRIVDDSVWLNRQQISLLFGRDVKTIGKHINNALQEELRDTPTVANFATVQREGDRIVTRNIEHYNLDVILSVGYRVKSSNGVKFRRWANQVLKDHLLKGYSINQRLMLTEDRIDQQLVSHGKRLDDLGGAECPRPLHRRRRNGIPPWCLHQGFRQGTDSILCFGIAVQGTIARND